MVSGIIRAIPENLQQETLIDIIVSEDIKTSEIEGEILCRDDVMSSVRKNPGISPAGLVKDKCVQGISSVMVRTGSTFTRPLSEEMLFEWHSLLMCHRKDINPGEWRTGTDPVQVVSGAEDHITVHFEAPPSQIVPSEMGRFITWFNESAPGAEGEIEKAPVRAAIAHLRFGSIHPFEDGNGRISRAISEKALSRAQVELWEDRRFKIVFTGIAVSSFSGSPVVYARLLKCRPPPIPARRVSYLINGIRPKSVFSVFILLTSLVWL